MATVGNNTSREHTEARDAFFGKGEKEFFSDLMKNPEHRRVHANMLEKKADILYKKAMELIKKVELGEFNEEEMEKVEMVIAHCLAGIDDLHMELVLELTPDL